MASLDLTNVLEAASSSDDDDDAISSHSLLSQAEQYYVDNSRTMLLLALMSIGALDVNGPPLIDPDAAPWTKFPKKQIKPGSDLLHAKIKRRWQTAALTLTTNIRNKRENKEPASKNWDKNKLMKWLQEHPIATADDVTFAHYLRYRDWVM